jgi:hypothetical protein
MSRARSSWTAPGHAGLIAEQDQLLHTTITLGTSSWPAGHQRRECFSAACDLFESAGCLAPRTAEREARLRA